MSDPQTPSSPAPDAGDSRLIDGLIEVLRDMELQERTAVLEAEAGLEPERAEEVASWVDEPDRGAKLYELLALGSAIDGQERIAALLDRLREGGARPERFIGEALLGAGGMGQVRAVRDVFLRRDVALKSVHRQALLSRRGRDVWMQRFIDEAQITAQLEHPSIPPVHDIGVDADGRPFFTMQRVRGHGLDEVIEAQRAGRKLGGVSWTLERIVEVVRRVGEAVAYAHSRGVVHRDLKPENVMVGEYGAVYVVDWGLARTLDRAHDAPGVEGSIETERDAHPETPLGTRAGVVLGTLQYMAPEQALPEGASSGPLVDVYAMGAMLYRALAGHAPYGKTRGATSHEELLGLLRGGPPAPIDEVAPQAPAALRSILTRAMDRRPERRYPSVAELVEDLSAYLERRVVRAHRTGWLVAGAKWVERNRGLAVAWGVGALAVMGGTLAWRTYAARAAAAERDLAAEARTRVLFELPAEAELLAAEARALLPLDPEHRPALEALAARGEALIGSARTAEVLSELRAELGQIGSVAPEANAAPEAKAAPEAIERRIHEIQRTIDTVGGVVLETGTPRIEALRVELERASSISKWATPRARSVRQVVEAFAQLEQGVRGVEVPLAALDRPTVGAQLAWFDRLEAVQSAPATAQAWADARVAFADPDGPYGDQQLGLREDPRLFPLGLDSESGLLEFAHLATGEVPARGADGRLTIDAESAVVLVLLPGADVVLGASPEGPGNVDPQALPMEGPCFLVRLDPFLIGKYELTQGQFVRLTGRNPSAHPAFDGVTVSGDTIDERHPVESISWTEARRVLSTVGLGLPTSSQWEYAARAMATTPWSSGADPSSLAGHANLLDRNTLRYRNRPPEWDPLAGVAEQFDDPWPLHAPVGSCLPNAFGLHDMHGNVTEFCEDSNHPLDGSDHAWLFHGTGARGMLFEVEPDPMSPHLARGGSFASTPQSARIAYRSIVSGDFARDSFGVRAAMALGLSDD
ncbi:MAG: bifunctional serine/threonine-protein kinase/formylglycine-generating enzyme family protein [Planctomycetota bacterium]